MAWKKSSQTSEKYINLSDPETATNARLVKLAALPIVDVGPPGSTALGFGRRHQNLFIILISVIIYHFQPPKLMQMISLLVLLQLVNSLCFRILEEILIFIEIFFSTSIFTLPFWAATLIAVSPLRFLALTSAAFSISDFTIRSCPELNEIEFIRLRPTGFAFWLTNILTYHFEQLLSRMYSHDNSQHWLSTLF